VDGVVNNTRDVGENKVDIKGAVDAVDVIGAEIIVGGFDGVVSRRSFEVGYLSGVASG